MGVAGGELMDDYTLTFNGLTIGCDTDFDIAAITGLEDLPDVRSSDALLGLADGEVPGSDWLGGRDVVIEVIVSNDNIGTFTAALEAFKAAFVKGAAEQLVTFQLAGRPSRSFYARCRRRSVPVTQDYVHGNAAKSVVLLHATDPRIYDTGVLSASVPVFVAGSAGWDATAGAGVDAGFDSTAGAGVDAGWDATAGLTGGGLTVCVNSGSAAAFPLLTFAAPTGMSAWSLTNQTTGQTITFSQTLTVGETLVADMAVAATGKAGLPISIGGASRYAAWQAPRTPFYLSSGSNMLRFDVAAGDPNATALIQWQHTNI